MSASKDLFLKMREEEYLRIPEDVRQRHLQSKIYSESAQDFNELMQDKTYADLYKKHKKAKKDLDERTYQLRETKRKNNAGN